MNDSQDIVKAIEELWGRGRSPAEIDKDTLKPLAQKLMDPIEFATPIIEAAKEGGVRLLQGYLGQQNKDGGPRLYLSLDFAEYIDIPKAGVVLMLDLRTPFNPLAGQAVWVREGFELTQGQSGVTKLTLQSQFLGGDLTSGGMGGSIQDEVGGGRGGYSYPLRCGYSYPLRCAWSAPLRCQM